MVKLARKDIEFSKRYRWIVVFAWCIMAIPLYADSFYKDSTYSVSLNVDYAYNHAWSHHSNFVVSGFFPINSNFELSTSIGAATPNVYTFGTRFRPKFRLPYGELYLQSDIWYQAIVRNQLHDLSGAGGLGYRFDYANIYIGCGIRMLAPIHQERHSLSKAIVEPYNVVYQIDIFTRPTTNKWNLYFTFTNISETQMQRMFNPQLVVNALYHFNTHWTMQIGGQYQFAGLTNYAPTYYGHRVQTKIRYNF